MVEKGEDQMNEKDLEVQNEIMEGMVMLKRSIGYISREIDLRTLDDKDLTDLAILFYEMADELSERANGLTAKIKSFEEKEKKEGNKKEVIVRYVDNNILSRLMNNFVRIKNSRCEVSDTEDKKLNIDFIYTGQKNNKDIITTLEMMKIVNWEIFAGKIKFSKFDTVVNTGHLAMFSTSTENEIFLDWAKNQLLNIIQHKYPDKTIDIKFLFDHQK